MARGPAQHTCTRVQLHTVCSELQPLVAPVARPLTSHWPPPFMLSSRHVSLSRATCHVPTRVLGTQGAVAVS